MAKRAKDAAPDLGEIRKQIDSIDERIQALISERARCAQEVGKSKGEDAQAIDSFRPEREADVLRRVLERNDGPLRDCRTRTHHGLIECAAGTWAGASSERLNSDRQVHSIAGPTDFRNGRT